LAEEERPAEAGRVVAEERLRIAGVGGRYRGDHRGGQRRRGGGADPRARPRRGAHGHQHARGRRVTAAHLIASDPRLAATKVVVLTTFDDEETVFAAQRAGASGFLIKDVEAEELLQAVPGGPW
jgi:hypothetical protein